ncbi:hypothetical protein G7054_g13830 [Neopestalotiopsis clavispora]|nr:hypothetical protein G7054_g13830 [Neopestalotiopsis clavispora]
MIAKQLPYETLLVLQTLSRTLRRIIDPQLASEASKLSLVMRAEKDGTHNFCVRPPRQRRGTATDGHRHHHHHPDDHHHHHQQQRLGCFSCYRVLAMGAFAAEQLARDPFAPATAPAPFLRRYCVPCGLARGWHYPGEVIERRDGSTWWVCQCRRAWDKSTTLSCRHCGIVARAASAPADFFLNLLLLDRVLAGLSAAARAGILLTALSTRALVPLLAGSGVRHNV